LFEKLQKGTPESIHYERKKNKKVATVLQSEIKMQEVMQNQYDINKGTVTNDAVTELTRKRKYSKTKKLITNSNTTTGKEEKHALKDVSDVARILKNRNRARKKPRIATTKKKGQEEARRSEVIHEEGMVYIGSRRNSQKKNTGNIRSETKKRESAVLEQRKEVTGKERSKLFEKTTFYGGLQNEKKSEEPKTKNTKHQLAKTSTGVLPPVMRKKGGRKRKSGAKCGEDK